MGVQNFPDSASASGTGAGTLVYAFIPETTAEYLTPLLGDDAVYTFSVNASDPNRTGGISIEVYTTDTSIPKATFTVFGDQPVVYPKPISRIKVINGSPMYGSNTIGTMTGKYEQSGYGSYSVLSIRKMAKVTPSRTGTDNDSSLGDIYVHVEGGPDWSSSGTFQSGGLTRNGEDGYGWEFTKRWIGWAYNYNYTGVYRVGNNWHTGRGGPATNLALHASTTNVRTWQYKDFTTMTWTNLTPIPDELQYYSPTDTTENPQVLSQAIIMDTQLITYVMFRKRNTPITTAQTIAGQTGYFNQLLYKYTKATGVWAAIGAYNVTTWGDSSHAWGPKMFFVASDSGGNSYLFPWQTEKVSNSFWRYNLTTGIRSQATDSTIAWTEGTFVNGYFFVSPTGGIGNTDGSATDYQIYSPSTNAWSSIAPPTRTATNGTTEASTWMRGGSVFRYNSTTVGVIGRRTYTSNNTTPANNDRYWGRRFWTYDFSAAGGFNWVDRSADLGNYYPAIMRPGNGTDGGRYVWQAQTTDWDGRFLLIRNGESEYRSRGNYEYVNVKKPKQVTLLGQTGRARGEMSVGSHSVLAFGWIPDLETSPRVYQTANTTWAPTGSMTTDTWKSWGMEIVYVDGTVKYGPQNYAPQTTIFNPLRNVWYTSGWEYVQSMWVATTSAVRWARCSYIVDEKTGVFTKVWSDFDGNGAERANQETYSSGLAYNDVLHFCRPFDTDNWASTNLVGRGSEGSELRNQAFPNYTYHPNQPGTNTQRTQQTLSTTNDQRTHQIVQWGKGPRNIYGIPEGTLWWDGSRLKMYSFRDVQLPFSNSITARDYTETVGQQTGWRVIYTTPSVGARTTYTWYGTPKVWRDENYAICQNSTMETYYVFDLNNLYTREPKIINSHLPIEGAETPSNSAGNSATIGNNSQRWMKNAANVGGVEIVYGQMDHSGYRGWWNDNIYIVRDYPTPSTFQLDKNA
jgi:hypothetical protein